MFFICLMYILYYIFSAFIMIIQFPRVLLKGIRAWFFVIMIMCYWWILVSELLFGFLVNFIFEVIEIFLAIESFVHYVAELIGWDVLILVDGRLFELTGFCFEGLMVLFQE